MSDESENLIEDVFVKQLGAKYPFVKAKNCNTKYGITGFPTFVVLDADGDVVQTGMPSEARLEELLAAVVAMPATPAEPRFDALRQLWRKADFGKLAEFLDRALAQPATDASLRDVYTAHKAALDQGIAAQQQRVASLAAGPDYAVADDKLERIEHAWRGLPPAEAAKKERARIAADPALKKELAAGRALLKLVAGFDAGKPAQRKKLIAELERFQKANDGTFAGKQAAERLAALSKTGG